MLCPYCQYQKSRVVDTTKDAPGGIRRRRNVCGAVKGSAHWNAPSWQHPSWSKQDGTREEFNRDKLLAGIRIACAKRPVSAANIERLIGEIESTLQRMGKSEVSSRIVGDMVIKGLKELDHIAYVRYAIVYLQLDDLHAIRGEIDRLLSEVNYK